MAGRRAAHAHSGVGSARLIDLLAFGRPLEPTDGGSARFLAEADYIEKRLGSRSARLLAGPSPAVRSPFARSRSSPVSSASSSGRRRATSSVPGLSVRGRVLPEPPLRAWRGSSQTSPTCVRTSSSRSSAPCARRGQNPHRRDRRRAEPADALLAPRVPEGDGSVRAGGSPCCRRDLGGDGAEERDLLVRLYGLSPDRFVLVPNGSPSFEPVQRGPTDGTISVVYAGTLSPSRVDDTLAEAIEAALQVPDRDVRITLAGGGGEWSQRTLRRRARAVGGDALRAGGATAWSPGQDVALIVYFTEEPYYNLAHPSKLSLYVAAATPIVAGDTAISRASCASTRSASPPRARTTRTRSAADRGREPTTAAGAERRGDPRVHVEGDLRARVRRDRAHRRALVVARCRPAPRRAARANLAARDRPDRERRPERSGADGRRRVPPVQRRRHERGGERKEENAEPDGDERRRTLMPVGAARRT